MAGGSAVSPGSPPTADSIPAASDGHSGHPYYEIQIRGWCGMHALNNFLGGPYVTPDACRRACSQVVAALSEAAGGRAEDSSHHLDQESGWLSIDVINVLGQGLFGFHVEGHSAPLDEFVALGEGAALVNWNNQHWTVLISRSCTGPWIHINSVFEGEKSFHGKVETLEMSVVSGILTDIRRLYGAVALHCIVRASSAGHQFLEAAGLQAMLPPEDELLPDVPDADAAVLSDAEVSDASVAQEISLVTVNVDGLGDYPRSPTERMASILEEVLRTSPDFLLMQEVTMPMYMEIQRVLAAWKVKKRRDQTEEYFNVTATKWLGNAADRSTSFPFPSSNNGRHTLTVRRGEWAVINVHAESGPRSVDRDARAEQLRYMSRSHERDAARVHLLVGDLNARLGEDQCLLSEGWRDAWCAFDDNLYVSDDWTWQAPGHRARYDRVYMHNSTLAAAHCIQIERLTNVWGASTDHVALRAVVRMVPRHVSLIQGPRPQGLPDGGEAAPNPVSPGLVKEVGPCQISGSSSSLTETSDAQKRSRDVQVVVIASAVETEATRFHELVRLCQEDPMQREDVEEESLTPWKDIPLDRAFRVIQPSERGVQRWATPADKQAQRQRYAKCKNWALQCGLRESEFQSKVEGVPTDKSQRGQAGLPACLRLALSNCSPWQHSKLECVDVAIRRAAADAGRRLGGEQIAEQAAEEVSALMSSEAARLSRWDSLPKSWCSKLGLNMTPDVCKTLGHNPWNVFFSSC